MRLSEVKPLFETPASDAHESKIADSLKKKGFTIWAEPKGADAGWPDIGASIKLPESGEKVNLHIEAKMSKRDPMGSLRKWEFDGKQFKLDEGTADDNQLLILDVLNGNTNVKSRAKKLLSLLKKYFHKDVKSVRSGSLGVIKDKEERYEKTLEFRDKAKEEFGGTGNNFQLSSPKIKDESIGKLIIAHYKNKFKQRDGHNIILFTLGSETYHVPHGPKLPKKVQDELYEVLGVKEIPDLPDSFAGTLEVRVQVRHLSKKGAKPTRIDVMAILRSDGLTGTKGAHIT